MPRFHKLNRISPKSGLVAKFVNPIIDAINNNTEKTDKLIPNPDNIISYIYVDQTGKTLDCSRMITGDIGCKGTAQNNAIAWIRENSHAYGGRIEIHDGKKVMALKQLSDMTREVYANGEYSYDENFGNIEDAGNTEGTDLNVFMKLPTFWFKVELVSPNVYRIGFSNHEQDGWKCYNGDLDKTSLIGVYEANADETNDWVRSISSFDSTGEISWEDFRDRDKYQDENLHLITIQQHSIMQLLAYAYYGNTNLQEICGYGTGNYTKTTGITDKLGMRDTDTITGNGTTGTGGIDKSINFWGLENWWGNKYEWVDNIQVDPDYESEDEDILINVYKPGTTEIDFQFHHHYVDGCITKIKITEDGLILPDTCDDDYDSPNFGFAGSGYVYSDAGFVAMRSGGDAVDVGGVGCLSLDDNPDDSDSSIGSRLAYTGPVLVVDKFDFQD